MFAKIGWAYDLKTVSNSLIKKRAGRTGDGTRYERLNDPQQHSHENAVWGWGDTDMPAEDRQKVEIYNKGD